MAQSPNRHSELLGVRTLTHKFGEDEIQPITTLKAFKSVHRNSLLGIYSRWRGVQSAPQSWSPACAFTPLSGWACGSRAPLGPHPVFPLTIQTLVSEVSERAPAGRSWRNCFHGGQERALCIKQQWVVWIPLTQNNTNGHGELGFLQILNGMWTT